jgi:hypothetical protein
MLHIIPKSTYHAPDWYWIVSGFSQIWSSASLTYVERSNSTYTTWCATHHATKIANPEDLLQVMQAQVQPSLMAMGIVVKAPPKALAGTYAITESAHAAMIALATSIAAGRPLPGGGPTFNYSDMAGGQHAFTAPQFLGLANACDSYLYGWTQALISNLNGKGGSYPARIVTITA